MRKIIVPAILLSLVDIISYLISIKNIDYFKSKSLVGGMLILGSTIISSIIFFYFIKRYKVFYYSSGLKFSSAFKYGVKISIAWSIIASLFGAILMSKNKEIEKTFDYQIEASKEKIIEDFGSISASQQNNVEKGFNMLKNPMVSFGFQVINNMLLGLFLSLIGAALFKTKGVEEKTII